MTPRRNIPDIRALPALTGQWAAFMDRHLTHRPASAPTPPQRHTRHPTQAPLTGKR